MRTASSPVFENIFRIQEKTICVLRMVDGKMVALKIQKQSRYPEWSGCFCILSRNYFNG